MTDLPSRAALAEVLASAGETHRDYERVILKGVVDEGWAGFYAAFVLGRLGDFVAPSRLAVLLEEVDAEADGWPHEAAEYVWRKLTA